MAGLNTISTATRLVDIGSRGCPSLEGMWGCLWAGVRQGIAFQRPIQRGASDAEFAGDLRDGLAARAAGPGGGEHVVGHRGRAAARTAGGAGGGWMTWCFEPGLARSRPTWPPSTASDAPLSTASSTGQKPPGRAITRRSRTSHFTQDHSHRQRLFLGSPAPDAGDPGDGGVSSATRYVGERVIIGRRLPRRGGPSRAERRSCDRELPLCVMASRPGWRSRPTPWAMTRERESWRPAARRRDQEGSPGRAWACR